LAVEVAHEINNPLTVVIGECDLLLEEGLEPMLRESVTAINKAALQVQTVSNRLLEFVRGHQVEKEWLNLNRLVDDALGLLRRMLRKEGVDLQEELSRNLPWTQAHAGQIQQVVLNLVQNSRDALRGYRLQGIIKVRTSQRQDRLVLEVEDNGPGIPDKIRERIFEPFFTTKEGGKGTGLGLSVCAGIAREHGGELRLDPRVLGTCMVLELPIRQAGRTATN
jgi:signal transduction histidine kinase